MKKAQMEFMTLWMLGDPHNKTTVSDMIKRNKLDEVSVTPLTVECVLNFMKRNKIRTPSTFRPDPDAF